VVLGNQPHCSSRMGTISPMKSESKLLHWFVADRSIDPAFPVVIETSALAQEESNPGGIKPTDDFIMI